MRNIILFVGLLWVVVLPLCAQGWTSQDSLHLKRMLEGDGEVRINPQALKELETELFMGAPKADMYKSWMDFDTSMPTIQQEAKEKVRLTLRPYTANTKYNWDPVYKKKINVDKNTWRNEPFREITTRFIYSNWAKSPLDAGPRETFEQIEATGMRYRVTERVNNMAVARWQPAAGSGFSGDFMTPFTRNFWDVKGRKRRARTLEVLRAYGDSITVQQKNIDPSR